MVAERLAQNVKSQSLAAGKPSTEQRATRGNVSFIFPPLIALLPVTPYDC